MCHVYVATNHDWTYEEKLKYGVTKDPCNRLQNSHEQHSHPTKFVRIYKIYRTDAYKLRYDEFDKIFSTLLRDGNKVKNLQRHYGHDFKHLVEAGRHLIDNGGSMEFMHWDGLDAFDKAMMHEFVVIGLNVERMDVTPFNDKLVEINKRRIESDARDNIIKCDILDDVCIANHVECNNICGRSSNKVADGFVARQYQSDIIKHCIECLEKHKKCYIDLPTGAGKSCISYNIIKWFRPLLVIIITPRNIINEQNVKNDYLQILDDDYEVTNGISSKIVKKTIVVSCIHSYAKICKGIIENDLRDIFIWFDESHWGLDSWCYDEKNEYKQFLLNDDKHIAHRIFTTASPDKEFILKNKKTFGELYSPIKVKELISQEWLCNIKPYIFSMHQADPNIALFNLEGFENKHYGFSFHNCKTNACALFRKHLSLYTSNKTTIKPFLLVSSYDDLDTKDIELAYDYKDVKVFEKSEYSLAYVVSQYNMGYDFNKIDVIYISDPKMSDQDIKQTIGRGMRPDRLGADGCNLNKELHVYIPVFVDDDNAKQFNKTKEVLRYLLYDIELTKSEITFMHTANEKNSEKERSTRNYDGKEDVEAMLWDLIKNDNKSMWNLRKLTDHLCQNSIHNQQDYNDYVLKNEELCLPGNIFVEYTDFAWYNTYKQDECPYYSKKECVESVKRLYDEELYDLDDDERLAYLVERDERIPSECLWAFYGGVKEDYFT